MAEERGLAGRVGTLRNSNKSLNINRLTNLCLSMMVKELTHCDGQGSGIKTALGTPFNRENDHMGSRRIKKPNGEERQLEAVMSRSYCFLRTRRLTREGEATRGSTEVNSRPLLGRESEVDRDRRERPA